MIHAPLQAQGASPVRVPPLGRACACGAAAAIDERCADCEVAERLGAKPGLTLAPPGGGSDAEAQERPAGAGQVRAPGEDSAPVGAEESAHGLRGGAGVLQREPEAAAAETVDARPPEQLHVYVMATAAKQTIPASERQEAAGGTVGPYYPGDTILVQVWKDLIDNGATVGLNGIPEPIVPAFSSADIAVAETMESQFMLRVVGEPGPTAVEMTLSSTAFAQPLTVWIVLDSPPAAPDVLDPEAERRTAAVSELRGERREHRAEARERRREFRTARRAAAPEERSAMREEQRAARKATREEGRQLRRDLKAARADLAGYDETATFSRHRQGLIQAAIERGIAKAANAIARAAPGTTSDEKVTLGLETYFKVTSTAATAAQVRETLQRIVDVLSVARNSMLTTDYGQFDLGEDCDEETGAKVGAGVRGTTVTICKSWVEGEPDFGVTSGKSDAQAYALLHEFVHLSGISASGNEVYNHQGAWDAVTDAEAPTMADAYAAFAWKVGG